MHPTKTSEEEISKLEAEITYYKKLLDQSIKEDVVLEKTKEIFHELKILMDKLALVKNNLPDKARG